MQIVSQKSYFFSVITVVKNDQKNIQKTINSILNQTYKNYEYIIIDGKSSDNTFSQILKNKNKLSYYVSENDGGLYYAMNKGAKIANGKYIVYVNCGDKLTKNALKKIYKILIKENLPSFCFGTVKRKYTKDILLKTGFNSERLKYNFDFATSHSTGFFIKTSVFKKLKFFNTKFKYSADYDLYYRLIIKKKFKGISTTKKDLIGIVSAGGFSSKISFYRHLWEETKIRIHNKQNFFFIILIFINALIKNFYKRMVS